MKSRRRVYVKTFSLEEAHERWASFINNLSPSIEIIPTRDALGRITSEAVFALRSNPMYNVAAMDGFCVRFRDTIGASETSPKRLKLGTEAIEINTGDVLPEGFDAVVMVEDVTVEPEHIVIYSALAPYANVRAAGEDIVKTEFLVPERHLIRPQDIGALLAAGVTKVSVFKKPVVGIIPTGSEVIDPEQEVGPGNVIDFNSYMLGSMIKDWGGVYKRYPVVPDDVDKLMKTIERTLVEVDVLTIIAGSSAGTKDFTHHVVEKMGEVFVHGVNIKPGRPVLLGQIKGKPVLGIPGYPVSAWVAAEEFLRPLVYKLQSLDTPEPEYANIHLARPLTGALGQREYVRVKIGYIKDKLVGIPLQRGAGLISSLHRADGIVVIPENMEGIAQGTEVQAKLLRTLKDIKNNLICVGSHDLTLDLLAEFLKKRTGHYSVSSSHIGSMGGI
ncbi:MAG: molybdopterin biosynthesis protein, partial [Nitrospirae bacterium]